MKNLEHKKAAVDLTALAIGIVVLGIAVSIGAVIIKGVGNSQITNAATYQVANESFSPTTAGAGLSQTWVKSIDTVYNTTGGQTLSSGNWTQSINSDSGVATLTNSTCLLNAGSSCTAWKVTYTVYNTSDVRYAVPTKAVAGLGEYGNWFEILVIVGIAAVVLSLIFMAFGKSSGEGAAVSY